MPYVSSLLNLGWEKYRIYSGLPSVTPASQMKLFYGIDDLVLGYRFYMKKKKQIFTPLDSASMKNVENEAIKKNPNSLLHDGVSVMALFTGNAKETISLGARGWKNKNLLRLVMYTFNPFNLMLLLIKAVILLIIARLESVNKPHDLGSMMYYYSRILEELLMGEWAYLLTKKSIKRSLPVIYVNFFGFDEVSHNVGTYSKGSLYYLSILDIYLSGIMKEVRKSKTDYELVILSDHGQTASTQITKYLQMTLGEKIAQLFPDKRIVEVMAGKDFADNTQADMLVLNTGGLSLIYDAQSQNKLEKSQFEKIYPQFCSTVSNLPGIGFVLCADADKKQVVHQGKEYDLNIEDCKYYLKYLSSQEQKLALEQLEKLVDAEYAADIYIFSDMTHENKTVSFEYQNGAHGGLGGNQMWPFMISKNIKINNEEITDLTDIYRYIYQYVYQPIIK